ncbi:MAG: SPFH domain-containing protein [Deltaproteobacteria bacterium]
MLDMMSTHPVVSSVVVLLIVALCIVLLKSIYSIGPTQVGLVRKRFGAKLPEDNPIAFHGEAGYQAEMLMPGLRFKFYLFYAVTKHPWVQVPAGQIGILIAQIGQPLPIGAKSAIYDPAFANFTDLQAFVVGAGSKKVKGQKGVQRPVLSPGTLAPIHPVAFLVITKPQVYGVPVSEELRKQMSGRTLSIASFGLSERALDVTRIEPRATESGHVMDMIGVVTTLEGDPLPAGDIASRLGGFSDIEALERTSRAGGGTPASNNAQLIETILGSKNELHKSYQDFQAFLDKGGRIGLQHDPLLYGAYNLNPFLVRVEQVPMLVVEQGQVAVVKSYVGLPTEDTSGSEFKFGSLVKPGHRGIWEEPLRTGKYPINPRIYQAEIVPTSILKLDWSKGVTGAHGLDARLEPIVAKSREGFIFTLELQVLIHVPDTKAPRVISMVGSMLNLVNEVLQAALGNHFRNKLGMMEAVTFIQSRQTVQEDATEHISSQLSEYEVETKGVYIQDVILPQDLVVVLTRREIANQEIETFRMQQKAQEQRVATEATTGKADMQRDLAKSSIGIDINKNNADARVQQARGESEYIKQTGTAQADVIRAQGTAQADVIRAQGLSKAEGFKAQNEAIGATSTTLVNVATVLAEKGAQFVPQILALGGGSAIDGLAATLTKVLAGQGNNGSLAASAEKP